MADRARTMADRARTPRAACLATVAAALVLVSVNAQGKKLPPCVAAVGERGAVPRQLESRLPFLLVWRLFGQRVPPTNVDVQPALPTLKPVCSASRLTRQQ